MTCQNCQTAEGRLFTYRIHLLARIAVLCGSCLDRLTAMGLEFTSALEPERRAAQRGRLVPKDMTGSLR